MHPILDALLGRRSNPTKEWPSLGRQSLVYDLRARSLNGLPLSGTFEEARRFGRCDDIHQLQEDFDLFYRQSGLSLEFADRELVGIVFVVGEGSSLTWRKQMVVCAPIIIGTDGTRFVLSESSTVRDLTACFGPLVGSESDGDETTRTFISHGNWIESRHSAAGALLELTIVEAPEGAELEARARPTTERVSVPRPVPPPGLLNERSRFWIWWRGRVNLDPELSTPKMSRHVMNVLSREVAECSLSHERRGNEIRFKDLEIGKAWWVRSKAMTTGTLRLESSAVNTTLRYELTVWPIAPIALAVGMAFSGYGLVTRDEELFWIGLGMPPAATAIYLAADILIVRWFLRRTLKKALRGIRGQR